MERNRAGVLGGTHLLTTVAVIAALLSNDRVHAACQLVRAAEVPVVMVGLRPTLAGRINGVDTTFLLDSGAWFNNLNSSAAARLNLPHKAMTSSSDFSRVGKTTGIKIQGVGGGAEVWVTNVKDLRIFNTDGHNIEFLVGGRELGDGMSGLVGQSVLRIADVEYDLAHGIMRLFHETGCGKSSLAYWAGTQSYSVIDISRPTPYEPHTIATALLNGKKIKVIFDTGASTSFVALRPAEDAGFKPDQPGAEAAGVARGIGAKDVRTWIAPFASFKLGDEEIRNIRLRVGDQVSDDWDMLLGADFFLSHRIFVASAQDKLFFTYNGGPVFDLSRSLPGTGSAATQEKRPDEAASDKQ